MHKQEDLVIDVNVNINDTEVNVTVENFGENIMGNTESSDNKHESCDISNYLSSQVIIENVNEKLHFEEPPEMPPDLGNDDEFGDFESKSFEFDSESDAHNMPSESLVPFEENKDGFNYIGIITSVRNETISLNAALDTVKIDGHDSNLDVSMENLVLSDENVVKNSESENENFANFKISSDTDTNIKDPDSNNFEFKNAFNGLQSDNIPFADEKKSDLSSFQAPEVIPKSPDNKDNTLKEPTEVISNDNDDTFGDFSTFESEVVTNSPEFQPKLDVITDSQPTFSEDEDDFGDFDDYSSNSMGNNTFGDFSNGPKESLNLTAAINDPKFAEKVISEMFPDIAEQPEDFKIYDFVEHDQIFRGLKDITETIALSYQWPKSNSQEIFLKALNIDMRNIVSILFIFFGENYVSSNLITNNSYNSTAPEIIICSVFGKVCARIEG